MPEMQGNEATQAYRQEFPSSTLPIIAYSTLKWSQGELENCGFSSAIHKPCKKDELKSILAKFTTPNS